MTLYEKRMRELYPWKYQHMMFDEDTMEWIPDYPNPPAPPKKTRKARKTNEQARQDAINRDSAKCVECGATEHLEVHHIRYRSQDGTDELDNLVTLCAVCHAEKHKDESIYNLMQSRLAHA